MLKSITLENYKCFKESTTINIAPLTVLCGVNSSGKSSILKSLLMLKQSYDTEYTTQALLFNGKWVDNGFFNDIVYHKEPITDSNKLQYNTFSITNKFIITQYKNKIKSQDASSFRELRKIFYRFSNVKKFVIDILLTAKRSSNEDTNEFSKYIDDNQIAFYTIRIQAYDDRDNEIIGTDCEIVLKNILYSDRDYEMSWTNIPCSKIPSSTIKRPYKCTCYFSGLKVTNIYADDMPDEIRYVLPSLLSIFKIAALQYDGFQFIAPLRHMPERNYFIKGNVESVGMSGDDTPFLLAKLKGQPLITDMDGSWRDNFPPRFNTVKSTYDEIINGWTKHFNLGELEIRGNSGNVSINMSGHNITDVGFGVSQILPIITQGIIMPKNQMLLIEQPEIHLHPKMQMDMADFLLQLAKTDRNVIVETHSDHIINRIVRRYMECESIRDKIKIYFIDKNDCGLTNIETVRIDEFDGAICENENFFYQFASETEKIIDIGYKNLQKSK